MRELLTPWHSLKPLPSISTLTAHQHELSPPQPSPPPLSLLLLPLTTSSTVTVTLSVCACVCYSLNASPRTASGLLLRRAGGLVSQWVSECDREGKVIGRKRDMRGATSEAWRVSDLVLQGLWLDRMIQWRETFIVAAAAMISYVLWVWRDY